MEAITSESILSLGTTEAVAAQHVALKQEKIIAEMQALLRELREALAGMGKLIG